MEQHNDIGTKEDLARYRITVAGDNLRAAKILLDNKELKSDKEDFTNRLDEALVWAKESGYKEEDVNDIVKTYRNNKNGKGLNGRKYEI